MQRWKNILFNTTFFFNCLLLFFVLFYERLYIPLWMQVMGRTHPLLIHFPIVLLIFYIIWSVWFLKKFPVTESVQDIGDLLLLTAAFSAALTALMGILLSKEPGYDEDALLWHKWSGVSLAFVSLFWYVGRKKLRQIKFASGITAIIVFCLLIFAGDQGANITHGQDFLLATVLPEKKQPVVPLDSAVVFANMVQPILQSKCISCHNSKKTKGGLVMESTAQLLKGGKDGPVWDTTNPDKSLLMQRIHLPVEEKKHMPPEDKPQLTNEEMDILYYWIKKGASFSVRVMELQPNDTLRLLANNIFKPSPEEAYNFKAADEKIIQQLNNNNRVVMPLAQESPALAVDFYNSQNFDQQQLKELLKVKEQVVSLNLEHMPVKDEEVPIIAQFINLRKLNLNFTSITGKNIEALNKILPLKELAIAGTPVTAKDLQVLATFLQLKKVFVWNTSLNVDELAALKKTNARIQFETGFRSDTVVLKLTPPIVQNEEQVIQQPISLKLKHYINGTVLKYTLDGTDPDSLKSPVYDSNIILTKNCLLKARAYKPGWISSDVIEVYFYKSTYIPDSVLLLSVPDSQYRADGGRTLIDLVKGDLNFRNNNWLGYHGTKMETLLMFRKPVKAESITLSSLIDIGSSLMPPVSIEIWGGNEPKKLKQLTRITPSQPTKLQPAYLRGFNCRFSPVTIKVLKVIVTPVSKLPPWHPAKREKGWFFADEIFVN